MIVVIRGTMSNCVLIFLSVYYIIIVIINKLLRKEDWLWLKKVAD